MWRRNPFWSCEGGEAHYFPYLLVIHFLGVPWHFSRMSMHCFFEVWEFSKLASWGVINTSPYVAKLHMHITMATHVSWIVLLEYVYRHQHVLYSEATSLIVQIMRCCHTISGPPQNRSPRTIHGTVDGPP